MKSDTYRLQLILIFILGIGVLTLTCLRDSRGTGAGELANTGTWTLRWENDQLQFIAGEQKELPTLRESDPPPPVVTPIFFQRIPINHAPQELLVTISGIGPVLAQRIISERNRTGHYSSYEDLKKIRGIGEKTAMTIAEHVTFER